jgi:hypothetical protein
MNDTMHDLVDNFTKHLLDAAAVAVAIGTLARVLPEIAALFTIIWTGIRIYESETVQKFLGNHKA